MSKEKAAAATTATTRVRGSRKKAQAADVQPAQEVQPVQDTPTEVEAPVLSAVAALNMDVTKDALAALTPEQIQEALDAAGLKTMQEALDVYAETRKVRDQAEARMSELGQIVKAHILTTGQTMDTIDGMVATVQLQKRSTIDAEAFTEVYGTDLLKQVAKIDNAKVGALVKAGQVDQSVVDEFTTHRNIPALYVKLPKA